MCLRFICRLVINEYKEKEDLYCLLKPINEHASRYWQDKYNVADIPMADPIFTPRCLLDGHLLFPVGSLRYGENTKNTLVAWFGIMNPDEMEGLENTKKIIKDFITNLLSTGTLSASHNKIFEELRGLSDSTETGIIRAHYKDRGPLTISSVATLLCT